MTNLDVAPVPGPATELPPPVFSKGDGGEVQQRLLAGLKLSQRDLNAEMPGISATLLYSAVDGLKRQGFQFEREPVDGDRNHYRWFVIGRTDPAVARQPVLRGGKKRGRRKADGTPSVVQQVRERLLQGEALAAHQVAEQYDCHSSLLRQAVTSLEAQGHTFERTSSTFNGGRTVTYRLDGSTTPAAGSPTATSRHQPWDDQPMAIGPPPALRQESAGHNGRSVPPGPYLGAELDVPPPTLGEALQVYLETIADDGGLMLGLRRPDGTVWFVRVEGHAGAKV